ncbi:MAG: type IV pilus twitching motility protein PilT [Planctomycetes bacterium]|nr:type IV pilus twitching motility protein PilT [Planctomycetota bacterium]
MPAIDRYFEIICDEGSSDLHLSPNCVPMMRLHGNLVPVEEGKPALDSSQVERLVAEITPEKNRAQFEAENDTDFAYELTGRARFRCNLFRERHGVGGVFRQIPSEILTAEQLNLSEPILKLCHLSKGLVLVTGPTGSGKSTTLCAMIDYINRERNEHILTIEDPIEFVHDNKNCLINQREVGPHTTSFKRALRAALREDPDIILVGELRDLETIAIAIETAETGHLVFGTLHTSTAASTVDRVIDQFPADQQNQIRTMLAESLKGIIAQTLCRTKDGNGRVAALEVLIVNNAVSSNIREGKTHQIPNVMQVGAKEGMVTMKDALMRHVLKDRITPEEAYIKSLDKGALMREFELNKIPFVEPTKKLEKKKKPKEAPPRPTAPRGDPSRHKPSAVGDFRGSYADPNQPRRQPPPRPDGPPRRPRPGGGPPSRPPSRPPTGGTGDSKGRGWFT